MNYCVVNGRILHWRIWCVCQSESHRWAERRAPVRQWFTNEEKKKHEKRHRNVLCAWILCACNFLNLSSAFRYITVNWSIFAEICCIRNAEAQSSSHTISCSSCAIKCNIFICIFNINNSAQAAEKKKEMFLILFSSSLFPTNVYH